MYFTSGSDRAFEQLMQTRPGADHFDSGEAGAPEDCGTCRFYRPHWKYQFCVYEECPYQPGKLTALDGAVKFQVKGVDDEMAVFRVEKNRGYTVMSNHHLRNKDLSLKAKGLLSQMLSLPEDWDFTLKGLSRINREQIDAIRAAVTDPKGSLIGEVGQLLVRCGYRVKVLNTINFSKSMRYNPFRYIHSEKDILKLVNTLICNTKGEGEKSAEDFWIKSERLLYSALIGYIWYEAPDDEMNFTILLGCIISFGSRNIKVMRSVKWYYTLLLPVFILVLTVVMVPIESARQYKFTDCELILDTFIENARDYICAK